MFLYLLLGTNFIEVDICAMMGSYFYSLSGKIVGLEVRIGYMHFVISE